MLNLIPVLLLVIAAPTVLLLGRMKVNLGRAWLVALITSALVWVMVVVLGVIRPEGYQVENWITVFPGPARFNLGFTPNTWVLGFLLSSMLVIILLTEAKTLQDQNQLTILATEMILTATGILAVMANSPLAYLVTWVVIDLIEFGLLSLINRDESVHRSITISLVLRMFGSLLMVYVLVMINNGRNASELTGSVIFLIALLRIGILPIHKNYTTVSTLKRGVGTILRFIPPLTVASFLFFINPGTFPPILLVLLRVALSIGGLFGAISWLQAKDELDGRVFWILSIGCLSLIAFLTQQSTAIPGLMIFMVVAGLASFLYSPRFTNPWVFLVFLFLGLLTFPYTPTAPVRSLLWAKSFDLIFIVIFPTYILLIAGVFKHFLREESQLVFMETWMKFMYVVALVLILVTPWVAEALFFDRVRDMSNLGPSIGVAVISLMIVLGSQLLRGKFRILEDRLDGFGKASKKGLTAFTQVMNLDWFFGLAQKILNLVGKAITTSIKVQEGDGGLLWSILFLVLIASLLITRVAP